MGHFGERNHLYAQIQERASAIRKAAYLPTQCSLCRSCGTAPSEREATEAVQLHCVAVGHIVAQHVRQRVKYRHYVGNRHGTFLSYAYVATSRECSSKLGIPLDFHNSLDALGNLACAEGLAHCGHRCPLAGHLRITLFVVDNNFSFLLNGYLCNYTKTGILLFPWRYFLPLVATYCK